MATVLTLLSGVRWRGEPVVGERPQALLAALASGRGRVVSSEQLVEHVWGEQVPANAGKALQVVVSRTRALCDADAVVRDGRGYRLGVPADQVDAFRLGELARTLRAGLATGDLTSARDAVTEADALTRSLVSPEDADDGPLAALRHDAARQAAELTGLTGRVLAATGDHGAALPRLEQTLLREPGDETVLAALLRSEAAVRGAATALDRYERYRAEVRDRLGVDPGEDLQRVHRELLALDRPVREGLRYDATTLLGRDDDIARLRALVHGSRVVSIVGPGGLGKTRLAHVLGRDAEQPVVHFVELVAVTAPEDLVGEVGSALGVRDSISSRRSLTPQQRSDLRARIARHLAGAPSLLILDNCEHLVNAVADLVAFLVATVEQLTVITTTRAPLAIGAERVYQLGELRTADAVELFGQRAVAVRPDVKLPEDAVTDIVDRLDGLPLAIELAAAKARVMSVAEIRRRLEHRFQLLRGGVRGMPDRHQTLLAVIDWSWNLLDEPERRALRRLSVFHDGFTLDAAEAVLGDGALDALQTLADQSLLAVGEKGSGLRYRMLETIREFGLMHLVDAGEEREAYAARQAWATRYSERAAERLFGPEQFDAIDALDAEENNLGDALRHALNEHDPVAVIKLLVGLGGLWSMRGDHVRLVSLMSAVVDVVSGWQPPPELEEVTRAATALLLHNAMITVDTHAGPLHDLLARLGPGDGGQLTGMVKVLLTYGKAGDGDSFAEQLETLAEDQDRHVALMALQWRSHVLENSGDPAGALTSAERAVTLVRDEDGPWAAAILRTVVSQLYLQLGRRDEAARHARDALPVLERLGALDDYVQLRSSLVMCAVADGRLDDAAAELDQILGIDAPLDAVSGPPGIFGAIAAARVGEAELALAKGDVTAGLAAYLDATKRMLAYASPGRPLTGLEPWVLFGESSALTAYALYARAEHLATGEELFLSCLSRARWALDPRHSYLDYPAYGTTLYALAAWGLLHEAFPAPDAVRLLVLAERFAYNRGAPTMAWENIEPHAEKRAPGGLAAIRAEYGDRRGPDLLDEARALLERTCRTVGVDAHR